MLHLDQEVSYSRKEEATCNILQRELLAIAKGQVNDLNQVKKLQSVEI